MLNCMPNEFAHLIKNFTGIKGGGRADSSVKGEEAGAQPSLEKFNGGGRG